MIAFHSELRGDLFMRDTSVKIRAARGGIPPIRPERHRRESHGEDQRLEKADEENRAQDSAGKARRETRKARASLTESELQLWRLVTAPPQSAMNPTKLLLFSSGRATVPARNNR